MIYAIVTQDLCNCVIIRGGKVSQAYIKQSVILNYPLSSVAMKHPVDGTFPTHCPWLPSVTLPMLHLH